MGEKPRFGDIVENGWASEDNPTRTGFFVRQGCRAGRMNAGPYVEVTDGNGKFWELPTDKGHRVTFRPAAGSLSDRDARIAELEGGFRIIAEGTVSSGQNGHYLAHRYAVKIARALLTPTGTEIKDE